VCGEWESGSAFRTGRVSADGRRRGFTAEEQRTRRRGEVAGARRRRPAGCKFDGYEIRFRSSGVRLVGRARPGEAPAEPRTLPATHFTGMRPRDSMVQHSFIVDMGADPDAKPSNRPAVPSARSTRVTRAGQSFPTFLKWSDGCCGLAWRRRNWPAPGSTGAKRKRAARIPGSLRASQRSAPAVLVVQGLLRQVIQLA
jgi:hypothetical protein